MSKTYDHNPAEYANVPIYQLPGWHPEYAQAVIAEDGLVMAYGDYYANRLGYASLRQMLVANASR